MVMPEIAPIGTRTTAILQVAAAWALLKGPRSEDVCLPEEVEPTFTWQSASLLGVWSQGSLPCSPWTLDIMQLGSSP